MAYILFIDTNILLDFYRARNDAQLDLLLKLDSHHDVIVTTYQVEMEFKKNRQEAILSALKELKRPDGKGAVPAFFKEGKTISAIDKSLKQINAQVQKLHDRTKKLMANPTTADPVYKPIQRLFRSRSSLNLSRDRNERKDVRRRALKRCMLGYPPRKTSDTSIGDAINWEWIVDCATHTGSDVIIVSRDADYGVTVDNKSYINDWLLQEFRSRVSKKRKLHLTCRLTEALPLIEVAVTPEDEQQEAALIAGDGVLEDDAASEVDDPDMREGGN